MKETKNAIVVDSAGNKITYVLVDVASTLVFDENGNTQLDADGNVIMSQVDVPKYYTLNDGESLIYTDVSLANTMIAPMWDGSRWFETGTPPEPDVEEMRTAKLAAVGKACSAAIYAGIDLDSAHYSLTEHDQIELMAQQAMIQSGATSVPYHADGELCRMFTADEFMAVAKAAEHFIFYNRSYVNHLNVWIRRAETAEELEIITYGVDLPDDLAASLNDLIASAGTVGE